jgi:hypothetical protein
VSVENWRKPLEIAAIGDGRFYWPVFFMEYGTIGQFTPPNLGVIRGRIDETDPDLRCLIRP